MFDLVAGARNHLDLQFCARKIGENLSAILPLEFRRRITADICFSVRLADESCGTQLNFLFQT